MMDASGREEITPGQVVVGNQFSKMVDPRKGLTVYRGERPVGRMAKVNPRADNRVNIQKATTSQNIITDKDLPNYIKPAQTEEVLTVDPSATTGRYLDKNLEEWKTEAHNGKLPNLSRGQLIGLGKFLGVDVTTIQEKNQVAQEILSRLAPIPMKAEEKQVSKK